MDKNFVVLWLQICVVVAMNLWGNIIAENVFFGCFVKLIIVKCYLQV